MVRFEKLAYEISVNSAVANRARKLTVPTKPISQNRYKAQQVDAMRLFNEGLTGKLFRFLEPIFAKFTYQHQRDLYLQKGLHHEDFELFSDREMRRCYLFETIMRQGFLSINLDSIHTNLFCSKQEELDIIKQKDQQEDFLFKTSQEKKLNFQFKAEERSMGDFLINKDIFEEYKFKNYMSDMTPGTRFAVIPRYHPLEFFNVYGWWRTAAWDRYFLNEAHYDNYTEADLERAQNPFSRFNLETEQGKKEFEVEIERFVKLYPGSVCREGEKFDFQNFYARKALRDGKDTGKFGIIELLKDPEIVEKAKSQIKAQEFNEHPDKILPEPKSKSLKLGSILPEFLRPKSGKGLF